MAIKIYDPGSSRERRKHALAHDEGQCALFQRRMPEGDLQYEAHYLSPCGLQFLDWLSAAQPSGRSAGLIC